jgi:hypothetical protein
MRTEKNNRTYTKLDAQRYVAFLGCWTFANPIDAANRRDLRDYLHLLTMLIEVNKTRHDHIGRWETEAAKRILAKFD